MTVAACHVWWARARHVAPSALDERTRERIGAMHVDADRDRHATAVLLAGQVVRACAGERARVRHVRGHAPEVIGARLSLSITHASEHVGVAICTTAQVGVDVEPAAGRADLDGLAAVVLGPAERSSILARPQADRHAALLRAWVRKEAVLKATGEGLSGDPAAIDVRDDIVGGRLAVVVDLVARPGAYGALAVLAGGVRVDERDGDAIIAVTA